MAAMVNMNNLLNGKDSRWLQLEVCREFQRQKCTRPDTECKFAHPPANVEVQNGRVTACYDSIKGRCNREKPPCKYFHPPQHLKDQLLINGRNHLALKNALMQQMGLSPGQPIVPGQVPTVATNPYLTGMPQVGSTYSPYFGPSPIMPTIMGPAGDPTGVGSPLGVVPQTVAMQQKMQRTDRLETAALPTSVAGIGGLTAGVHGNAGLQNANMAASIELGKKRMRDANDDLLMMDMKTVGSLYYENFAFPGMVPYKRPAGDKSGVPVYQPTSATTYQQLMQLQQPYVPVSCEYTGTPPLPAQNSNQTVLNAVQNSIQNQVNTETTNGLLADATNPPPPPPPNNNTTTNNNNNTTDKQTNNNNSIESENSLQNSHDLNHKDSSPQVGQLQQAINNAVATSMNSAMPAISSINSMVSIANLNTVHSYTMAGMGGYNVLNSLNYNPSISFDPATLAKEVAQKNYAKALKLSHQANNYQLTTQANYNALASQANYNSLTTQAGYNPLNALNYTGVTLNKQTIPLTSPTVGQARGVLPSFAQLQAANLAAASPYQAGLLHYARSAAAAAAATPVNPYSLIRQQMIPANHPYLQTMQTQVQSPAYAVHNPYAAAAVLSGVPQLTAASPATIAAQPQIAIPVSTGVIMQPYKKMKTT